MNSKCVKPNIRWRMWLTVALLMTVGMLCTATGCGGTDAASSAGSETKWQYEVVSGSCLRVTGCLIEAKQLVIPATTEE